MEWIIGILILALIRFLLFIRSTNAVSKRIEKRLSNGEKIRVVIRDDLSNIRNKNKNSKLSDELLDYISIELELIQSRRPDMDIFDFVGIYHDFLKLYIIDSKNSETEIMNFASQLDSCIEKNHYGRYIVDPRKFIVPAQ